ncbi:DUF4229 domain-containing protein [Blastococcus sp. CT_GayMR19]|uniref:DUF4229 domain-containing protein n=1 Tax=Blastococcus sp. CT_GayMR19 TaxID=2559608 RepID=UPI001074139C|nr:DUF4229 domain-containing protein [Blastococcus sp. CT_GayMR19]TFV76884.1 DUF4229 domain-containing protein [Blastococcus sp. CT_GayMR19]
MAESSAEAPAGGPATPPRVLPWLVMHTVGRLGIFALATLVLWMAGLDFWSGLLFGLLLSMPLAYLLLRRSRERLTAAFEARGLARRAAKEDLRTRLSGTGTE